MSIRWRLLLVAASLLILSIGFGHVAVALKGFGTDITDYAAAINELTPGMRNVSNMVAAVNFDIRGVDTLGEEIMLLCAVTGTVVLMRGSRGESATDHPAVPPGRPLLERTDVTVIFCRAFATLLLMFGIYVALHGTITPGGGFQGGVIAASGLLFVYLAEGYRTWRTVVRSSILDVLEGLGALVFVLAAALPLAGGHAAMENTLPLGRFKDLYSGGLMLIINYSVGLAVMGGFGLLLQEFLEETREPRDDDASEEQS